MEATTPIFEDIIIYLGHIMCLAAAVYMAKLGHIKIGLMLMVAFLLQIQVGYVVANIAFEPESQGACWATVGSYYECLPIAHRLSIHAGQLGTIILGVAIYLSARRMGSNRA
jgi:uncharacterized membrane protein YwaF